MKNAKIVLLSLVAAMPAGCGSVEIGNLGGCYAIDDTPAFRLDGGYGVHIDGRVVSRIRASENSQATMYTARPGLIAIAGENGYAVQVDGDTPEALGFVDQSLLGTPYFDIPTDAEAGSEDPMTVRAYRTEGSDC